MLLHHLKFHQFINGYLAVDFFFTLSGFVIGHAYEEKLGSGELTGAGFAWARFARLYPMMLLGAILGGISMAVRGAPATPLQWIGQLSWLPLTPGPSFGFALNSPQWSLVVEVVANTAHALVLRRLSKVWLVLMAAISVALWIVAKMYYADTPNMGVGTDQWPAALARVALSYLLGLLIYRLHLGGHLPRYAMPFPLLALAFVAAILVVPDGGLRDLVAVSLVWPLIVVAGIHAGEGRFSGTVKALGDISFPLYALHYPIVALFLPIANQVPRGSTYLLVVGLVALAWVAHTYLDTPVQKVLKRFAPPKVVPATS